MLHQTSSSTYHQRHAIHGHANKCFSGMPSFWCNHYSFHPVSPFLTLPTSRLLSPFLPSLLTSGSMLKHLAKQCACAKEPCSSPNWSTGACPPGMFSTFPESRGALSVTHSKQDRSAESTRNASSLRPPPIVTLSPAMVLPLDFFRSSSSRLLHDKTSFLCPPVGEWDCCRVPFSLHWQVVLQFLLGWRANVIGCLHRPVIFSPLLCSAVLHGAVGRRE